MVRRGWYWVGNSSGFGGVMENTLEPSLGIFSGGLLLWFKGSGWWINQGEGKDKKVEVT